MSTLLGFEFKVKSGAKGAKRANHTAKKEAGAGYSSLWQ
tara:strand:- start:125 stop:241 length:117 start_codon:yes stop_codon:yes gene_type:complete